MSNILQGRAQRRVVERFSESLPEPGKVMEAFDKSDATRKKRMFDAAREGLAAKGQPAINGKAVEMADEEETFGALYDAVRSGKISREDFVTKMGSFFEDEGAE